VKYGFVEEHRHEFSVRAMCRVLEVSPSRYYRWRRQPQSAREKENERLLGKIRAIHEESRRNYGSPKVYQKLRQQGEQVNHKRVEQLMKEHQIRAKRARKFKATTNSKHAHPVAENLLNREFQQAAPDRAWAGDITYVWTAEGWLYLAVFIDLYSRIVVGWSMSSRMTSELVEAALSMGVARRGGKAPLLVHTDRGSQYASASFRELVEKVFSSQSMSRKGNCWDNAVSESFFSALKLELVHHERFGTRREATMAIFDYIEVFYNRSRIHSSIGYLSPAEYEEEFKRAA
jgi:putative transposase